MDNLQQNLATLQALGLVLPTPMFIFWATVFNIVGLVAFYRGLKLKNKAFKWIGVVLMVYPLFISDIWIMCGVGCALSAALFFCRE